MQMASKLTSTQIITIKIQTAMDVEDGEKLEPLYQLVSVATVEKSLAFLRRRNIESPCDPGSPFLYTTKKNQIMSA